MAFGRVRGEVPRTVFHVLGGVLLVCAGYFLPSPVNRLLLGGVLLATLMVEGGRRYVPSFRNLTNRLLGVFMRPAEFDGLTGTPAFTGGVFLAFLLFSKEVAVASLIPLVVGDRAAVLAGKGFGRIRIGAKTLEGSLAFTAVTFSAYMVIVSTYPSALPFPWGILLAASVVGALVELLPRPMDDNLTIPLATGGFLILIGKTLPSLP
jgi:dolichol kinase